MNDSEAIAEFARISVKFGGDASMVQGAGGNTSVKLSDHAMAVKASGGRLKQMTATSGWVKVPVIIMRDLIARGPAVQTFDQKVDDQLVAAIDQATECLWPGAIKASIEASMHALFGKFVVHLHPVELNAVLTAKGGRALLDEILGPNHYLWIEVVPPGYYLGRAIYEAVSGDLTKLTPLVFLASHGVIAHGEDARSVERSLDDLTNKVSMWLDRKLPGRKAFDATSSWQSELHEPEIFPDTVVFRKQAERLSELPADKAAAVAETYAASAFMRAHHRLLGLSSETLPSEVCDYILGMSREKHRQQMYSKD